MGTGYGRRGTAGVTSMDSLSFFIFFTLVLPPQALLVGDDFSEFDVDGSSAYSDWQESLALATSNKTLSQLLKP